MAVLGRSPRFGRFSLRKEIPCSDRMSKNLYQLRMPPPVTRLLANLTRVQTDPRRGLRALGTASLDTDGHRLPRGHNGSVAPAHRRRQHRVGGPLSGGSRATDRLQPSSRGSRPELSMLAKWQRVSPSALRHRYDEQRVQSVRELLKPEPLIDIVLEPFISVVDSDFKGISPELDEQLKLHTHMRSIVSEEFVALFGENAPKQMGFVLQSSPRFKSWTATPSRDPRVGRHRPWLRRGGRPPRKSPCPRLHRQETLGTDLSSPRT